MKTIDLYNNLETASYTPSITELAIDNQRKKIHKVPELYVDEIFSILLSAMPVAVLPIMIFPAAIFIAHATGNFGIVTTVLVGTVIIIALTAAASFVLPSVFNAIRDRRHKHLSMLQQQRLQEFTAWVEDNHDITLKELVPSDLSFNQKITVLDTDNRTHVFNRNNDGAYMLAAPKTFNQISWVPRTKQRRLTTQMERLETKVNLLKGKKLNIESQHAVQRVKSDYQELLTLQEELPHQTKTMQQTFVDSLQQLEAELDEVAATAYREAEKRYATHNTYIQGRKQRKLTLS